MRIYNTLSRTIEEFIPIDGKKVNLFVCGPTVYNFAHVGNAKTYTQFDFIVKFMRACGFDVFYLQNITDIDDKIIKRSAERGISWQGLAKEFEDIYFADMLALGNTAVTEFARATDFIPQIVKQVKTLMGKGFAYQTTDGIYFDVSKFADYGKLSGRSEADLDAGVSRVDEGLDKKNKNDFCLWKFFREGDPFWETEIGKGRPGWHIEDTAITESFFGPQYDVHGGAVDLIFPHHEAEITQMESASGKSPLVRFWIHAGFLNFGSEKMSKSKGNFWTIRDVLEKFDYRVLRLFFAGSHYRSSLEFSEDLLEQAKGGLKRIDDFVSSIDPNFDDEQNEKFSAELVEKVFSDLNEDFDTPSAMATLFNFIREQNVRGRAGKNVFQSFAKLNEIFGFMSFSGAELPETVKVLFSKREELRKEKKFDQADLVRKEMEKLGYTVKDSTEGSKVVKL